MLHKLHYPGLAVPDQTDDDELVFPERYLCGTVHVFHMET